MAATTDGTEEHTAAPASRRPPARRRGMGRIAMAVSVFGELLITAGLVLGLFVVYSLWWTNVLADRAADKQADKVRDIWAHQDDGSGRPATFDSKDGIGFLHVPAMSGDEILVEKGTTSKILNDGVAGYYTDPVKATLPTSGKKGNFSLAAHRDGHGAEFHNIHKIEKGDPIVFETKDKWYVYKVYAVLPETSKYNVKVLSAIPKESGKTKAGHYITLTTCTPVYTSRYRYIVWGELERVEKVDKERTPPEELRG
ncbi:class E sortase [Streptomyces sp. ISL-22]|uniref:class E sortase n=1 Tax=unclassified Streptomyces TaxID=2593676 RepID=UPI001BE96766|nr:MULTISPECIES: class E sortase [unclassified Streptomyces]MBT2422776.1 class E sortase [Streptomyces sp. ISL-24]MBT2431134.1 class E sortase [Streptomyces sp. ISL-22]